MDQRCHPLSLLVFPSRFFQLFSIGIGSPYWVRRGCRRYCPSPSGSANIAAAHHHRADQHINHRSRNNGQGRWGWAVFIDEWPAELLQDKYTVLASTHVRPKLIYRDLARVRRGRRVVTEASQPITGI